MAAKRKPPVMDGLPMFDATKGLMVILTPEDMVNAVPGNAELCGIALGSKRQFGTPYTHITRTMAFVALPDKVRGVSVPGWCGKWVHNRFELSKEAQKAVILVDTGKVDLDDDLVVVELVPPRPSKQLGTKRENTPEKQAAARRYHEKVRAGIPTKKKGKDVLTQKGVRNYSGKLPV